MPFVYKGWIRSPLESDDYSRIASSGFLREKSTKAAVLKTLAPIAHQIPVGTEIEIEKIYHMKRGYEPAAPFSHGQVAEVQRMKLVDQGAWYDPKTGKARPAKWKTINRSSRRAGHETFSSKLANNPSWTKVFG